MAEMSAILLRLRKSLHRRLKATSHVTEVPMNMLINKAIVNYLKRLPPDVKEAVSQATKLRKENSWKTPSKSSSADMSSASEPDPNTQPNDHQEAQDP